MSKEKQNAGLPVSPSVMPEGAQGTGSRVVPVEVLLSITTGVLVCEFSQMHDCIEFLAGHPVWIHQLAHKPFVDELSRGVRLQHPQLPADAPGVTTENWRDWRDKQIAQYGVSLLLKPLASVQHLRESFHEPLKGKAVITLGVGEDAPAIQSPTPQQEPKKGTQGGQ